MVFGRVGGGGEEENEGGECGGHVDTVPVAAVPGFDLGLMFSARASVSFRGQSRGLREPGSWEGGLDLSKSFEVGGPISRRFLLILKIL